MNEDEIPLPQEDATDMYRAYQRYRQELLSSTRHNVEAIYKRVETSSGGFPTEWQEELKQFYLEISECYTEDELLYARIWREGWEASK
jgi:hypothetical protein